MKKLLMLAVLVATLGITAAAESPIKLSLYDNIAWPKPHNTNVVLGIVDNNTPTVHGVSLAIGSSRAKEMWGLSAALIYARSNELRGLQSAIYNVTYDVKGVTSSIVDYNKGRFVGAQLGFVNLANNMKGLQWGFYNQAERMSGLQLGFVNYIKRIDCGLQIGLLNIIEQNGWLPFMVIANGRF